ncbi:MAG: ferredoxin reductase family protein [Actinomycetota bacterium]
MQLRQTRATSYLGPGFVALACLVPLVLWAQAAPLGPRFADAATTLRSVAVLCGLAGIVAFSCNLVLGGRVAVLEVFFGGLDRMYRIHHRIGLLSFNLLLAHGVLMLASAGTDSLEAAVRLVLPSPNWTVTLGALALLGMILVMGLTLYADVNHEVFLWVHRFFGLVFGVAALHVFRTPGTKALSQTLTIYLAVFVLAGVTAYLYRSLLGDLFVRRRPYRVSHINRRGGEVAEITLSPSNGGLPFTPGQFVFLTFQSSSLRKWFRPFSRETSGQSELVSLRTGAVHKQFHPFSITSSPEQRDLQVAIKASGDYTGALEHLEVGDHALIEGPYGTFSYRHVPRRRQIWIAGGIGVTPFLSMARSLSDDYRIDFYYAVKTRQQGYFFDDFEELSHSHPNLRLIAFPEDEVGFLTAEEVERRSGDLTNAEILMCGPKVMTQALERQLKERGVPGARIHYEEFGFVR